MLDLKRIFAGLLAVCLLSGCTAREQDQKLLEQSLNTPFETTAHLQYQGVDAQMTIQGDGAARSYTLSFTEPASLADVAMVFTEDKVTVQYQDLSVSVKPETLTDGMAGDILMDTLQTALGSENVELTRQDGVLTVKGKLDNGGSFELRLDSQTGNFLSLAMPENDFFMEFSGFEFYR